MSVEVFQPDASPAQEQIQVTEQARDFLLGQLQQKNATAVRFCARKAGCSGYKYELDYVSEVNEQDQPFEFGALTLYVSKVDLPLLGGTEIDCVQEGLNRVIRYRNPKAEATCGCGESFAVSQS